MKINDVSQVTDDYIISNFDIEKNRKYKNTEENLGDIEGFDSKYSINDFFNFFKSLIEERKEDFLKRNHKKEIYDVNFFITSNEIIEDCTHPFYSGEMGYHFELHVTYSVKETDKQVISRIKSREKQKIKKKNNKTKEKNIKMKQLEKLAKEMNVKIVS